MPADLLATRRNDYSQNGEDGIIDAIFAAIAPTNRWCCEFGAWDGLHFSNSRRLKWFPNSFRLCLFATKVMLVLLPRSSRECAFSRSPRKSASVS